MAVDETSWNTDWRTLYQVSGILRLTKQVGVQIGVPCTRYQVYRKKQAEIFSKSEQKRG